MSEELTPRGYHPPVVKEGRLCMGCRTCELMCPDLAIFIEEAVAARSGERNVERGVVDGETRKEAERMRKERGAGHGEKRNMEAERGRGAGERREGRLMEEERGDEGWWS